MMDKRVILTIVVSLVAMWAWLWLSQKVWPPPPPPKPSAASQPASAPGTWVPPLAGLPPASQPGTPGAPVGPATQAIAPATQPATRPVEELVELPVGTDAGAKYRATITTWGGGLKRFRFTDHHYQEERGGLTIPIDLVRTVAAGPPELPLRSVMRGRVLGIPDDAVYAVVKKTAQEVVLVHDGAHARVEKRYQYDPQTYVLNLALSVTNKGPVKEDELKVAVQLFGHQHADDKAGGFFKPPRNMVSGACYVNGSLDRENYDSLAKKAVNKQGDVRWVAIDEKFFVLAVLPMPDKEPRGCGLQTQPGDKFQVELRYAPKSLAPGQTETFPMVVYAGPKIVKTLDALTVGGQDPKLSQAVDFGWFAFIARPLLWILKFFQSGVRNWGLAIILLTIFVKLITLYWTQKSMRSMQGMAKLKPKISVLQAKYKDDKQRLNQEMMALYKAHGVNPLSGCLPMLLQMPIWIALYSTLQVAVELYRMPFVGWLNDLTAPDRYYVLPVATGLLMFVQQKLSPTPQEGQQAKMMLYMMPIMFTGFTLFVPSGLTLYILTNTVLAMGHQMWMNRQDHGTMTQEPAPLDSASPEPKVEAKPRKGKGKN
jgi:YidC/Oxa1 family membrane protein insertase